MWTTRGSRRAAGQGALVDLYWRHDDTGGRKELLNRSLKVDTFGPMDDFLWREEEMAWFVIVHDMSGRHVCVYRICDPVDAIVPEEWRIT